MKFSAFNLNKDLVSFLEELGYVNATEIQDIVIPKALKNENIIVKSETGSGKTHAFLVPILNNVEINGTLQYIILSPSRELARQTYDFAQQIRKFEPYKNLSIKLFVSGEDSLKDAKSFNNGCEIVIATPGKLLSLIKTTSLSLENVKTIVLDEADMLMEEGFFDTIDEIMGLLNKPQIEVFSATVTQKVEILLKKYISSDYVLTLDSEHFTSKSVKHYFINTKHQDINFLVKKFIEIKNPFLLLIFTNSKAETRQLYNYLNQNKIKSGILSGELEPRERKAMLRRIKKLEFQVVVCSDLASRGIDIDDVSDVLSIGLPNNLEYYYHRAGRTGRNYKEGNSYVFYDHDSKKLPLKLIEAGLDVEYLKFGDDALVPDQPIIKEVKKTKRINTELEKDIKKAKAFNMGKKVKPGYKKKVKRAIDKVKSKHRREVIKKDIRRQREERYRQQGNE